MCGCEVCICANIISESLIDWKNKYLKWLHPHSSGCTRIRYVKNNGTRYSKYRDEVVTDGKILYKKSGYDEYSTMYPFLIVYKSITHCNCIMNCFSYCNSSKIPYEGTQDNIDTPNIKYHMTGSIPRCPLLSHSLVCTENHLFIVKIGPILNKDLEFIFRSDCSDCTYVYS